MAAATQEQEFTNVRPIAQPKANDEFTNVRPLPAARPSEAEQAAALAPGTTAAAAAAQRRAAPPMRLEGMPSETSLAGPTGAREGPISSAPLIPTPPGTTLPQALVEFNKPYAKWEGAGALTAATGGAGLLPAAGAALLGGAGGEAAQQLLERATGNKSAPKSSTEAATKVGIAGAETGGTELALGVGGKLISGAVKKFADPLGNAIQKVFKAAGPPADPEFRAAVGEAAPDLKAIYDANPINESDRGGIINPDKRIRKIVGGINDYLSNMYHTERAGQVAAGTQIGAHGPISAVKPDVLTMVSTRLAKELPLDGEARSVAMKLATDPGADLSVAELDTLQRAVGAELRKFKGMSPQQQAAVRTTSKWTTGLESMEDGLKTTLDDVLTRSGQPGLKDYNRRYAALTDVRDALQKRMNPAEANQFLDRIHEFFGTHGVSARVGAGLGASPGRNLEQGLKGMSKSAGEPARAIPAPPGGQTPQFFHPVGPPAAQALPPPPAPPPATQVGAMPPLGFQPPPPNTMWQGTQPRASFGAPADTITRPPSNVKGPSVSASTGAAAPASGIVGAEFKNLKMTGLVTPRQQMTLETMIRGPRWKGMDAGEKVQAIKAILQGERF